MYRHLAVILALLPTALLAQVPPGTLLGTRPGAVVDLVTFDRNAGRLSPILDPQGLLAPARRAILGNARATIIAAVDSGSATGSDAIAEVQLSGATITGVRPLTRDLGERVVGLDRFAGGTLALCTPSRTLIVPTGSMNPASLAAAPPGITWVAVRTVGTHVASLGSGPNRAAVLAISDPATGGSAWHQIGIAGARSMALDHLRGGLVIGDDTGALWLVDLLRFIASPTGVTLPAPIDSIAYDSDREVFVLSTALGIYQFDGAGAIGPLTAPAFASLDYAPFASGFTTYGTGCATGTLAPAISATGRPFPGSLDFVVRLAGATPGTRAYLMLGVLPLALPLASVGMTGCTLLVQPLDLIGTAATPAGGAALRLPIPPSNALVGAAVFTQWITVAPGANPTGLLASDGGRIAF